MNPKQFLAYRLRPVRMSDASILLAWRNDSEVIRWSRIQARQEDLEGHLRWTYSRVLGKPGEILRIIETEVCDIPVGLTWTTFNPDDASDIPEVHYRVAAEWRHHGIASICVPMFVRECVTAIRGGRFKCPIIRGNSFSERIASKLGLHPGPARLVSDVDHRVLVDWVQ